MDILSKVQGGNLSNQDNQAIIDAAKSYLTSNDPKLKMLAIDIIGALGNRQDKTELAVPLVKKNTPSEIKIKLIWAIASHSNDFKTEITAISKDKNNFILAEHAKAVLNQEIRNDAVGKAPIIKLGRAIYDYIHNDYSSRPSTKPDPALVDKDRLEKIRSLESSPNPNLVRGYAAALAYANTPDTDAHLRQMLKSDSPRIVNAAIEAISLAQREDLLADAKTAIEENRITPELFANLSPHIRITSSLCFTGLFSDSAEVKLESLKFIQKHDPLDKDTLSEETEKELRKASPEIALLIAQIDPSTADNQATLLNSLRTFLDLDPAAKKAAANDALKSLLALENNLPNGSEDQFRAAFGSLYQHVLENGGSSIDPTLHQQFTELVERTSQDAPLDDLLSLAKSNKMPSEIIETAILRIACLGDDASQKALLELATNQANRVELREVAASYLLASPFKPTVDRSQISEPKQVNIEALREKILGKIDKAGLERLLTDLSPLQDKFKESLYLKVINEHDDLKDKALDALKKESLTVRSAVIAQLIPRMPEIMDKLKDFSISTEDLRKYLKEFQKSPEYQKIKDTPQALKQYEIRAYLDIFENQTTQSSKSKTFKEALGDIVYMSQLDSSESASPALVFLNQRGLIQQATDSVLENLKHKDPLIRNATRDSLEAIYTILTPEISERSPKGFNEFLKNVLLRKYESSNDNFYREFHATLNQLNSLGLKTLDTLEPKLMNKIYNGRALIERLESKENGLVTPAAKDNLIIFLPKADHNNAITSEIADYCNKIGKDKNIFVFEVEKISDIAAASERLANIGIKADRILIAGHGSETSMDLSQTDSAVGIDYYGDSEREIHVSAKQSLQRSKLGALLATNGVVDLMGCLVGQGLKTSNNLASMFRDIFPHAGAHKIISFPLSFRIEELRKLGNIKILDAREGYTDETVPVYATD